MLTEGSVLTYQCGFCFMSLFGAIKIKSYSGVKGVVIIYDYFTNKSRIKCDFLRI